MKKTTFKRLASLALAMILLVGCFPMAAFAEETLVPETCEVCGTALTETAEGFVCDVCIAQPETCEVCGTALTETAEGFVCDVCTAQPEIPEEPEIITETVTLQVTSDLELPDHEELFAAFVERELYDYDIAFFGTAARAGLNAVEKAIYDALKAKIEYVALHGGSTEFTLDNIPGLKTSWTNKELNLTFDNLFAAFDKQFDLGRIIDALLADCPFDLYWYDKIIGAGIQYSGTISSTYGQITDITMPFPVVGAYRGSKLHSVTTNVSKVTAAKATAEQVVANNRYTSDYETLLAFKNYICNAVSYNDDAAENDSTPYGDPWQLIYVFDNNSTTNVVCEGYSKAFQYLCDLAGLDCISVSGTTNGPHMWNVVTLNGKKYLVDVTNSDSGTIGSNGSLFLAGAPYKNGKYTFDCGNGTITYSCDNLGLATTSYDPLEAAKPLSAPAKPHKIVNNMTGPKVYWKAVSGAVKYNVWRSENGANGTYSKVGSTTALNYLDNSGAVSGKTYFYKISAVNGAGVDGERSPAMGIQFLDTPDVTTRINSAYGIKLGWNKVTGATGYAVYRMPYGGSTWERITTLSGGDTLTYTDSGVKSNNGTVYKYTIRALGGSNLKTMSGCYSGRTMVRLTSQTVKTATKAGANSIKCSWTTSGVVTGYEVRFMIGGTVYKTFTVGNPNTGSKTFSGLKAGQTYDVQVRTYKKVEGVGAFYSAWSVKKNVTI